MKVTKVTKANEAVFLPFLPGTALQDTATLIRIGVTDDRDNVAGVMAVDTAHVFLELLALYILPDYRRRGYGRSLMDLLEDALTGDRYTAISAGFMEGNGLSAFFSSLGYDVFPSSGRYSFALGEFLRSDFCRRYIFGKEPQNIKPISELDRTETGVVEKYLENRSLPLMGWYDPQWSTVLIRNREITSIMLCGSGLQGVSLIWLHSKGQFQNEIIMHMRFLVGMMQEKYDQDRESRITFMAESRHMLDFMVGILGGLRHLRYETRFVQVIKLL